MTPTLNLMHPAKRPGTAAAMIALASSQVGYREGPDNDTAFGAWYGMNHAAWCAIFQSWAAAHSGCAGMIPRHAYTPAGAGWFQAHHQWGTLPRVGALAYIYSPVQGRIHHVALVTAVHGDGSFSTVEGNTNTTGSATGNGVYRLRRRGVGAHGGFGYPRYRTAVPVDPPKVSAKAAVLLARAGKPFEGPLAAALRMEGLPATRAGYAHWQATAGFRGVDADGLPGIMSLRMLAKRHGLFEAQE